jgi:hypothetical protein
VFEAVADVKKLVSLNDNAERRVVQILIGDVADFMEGTGVAAMEDLA